MTGGDVNAVWAGAFLDELSRSGVRHICVAPGSRSTPLVLAAARDGRFRMTSVVDERSAGFFALGMGKASGCPAAVITTSGTAGANLYPAVIEASQGEVPLLVLTADRPHRLRDTDANQAVDQIRLFGAFPRSFMEVSPPLLTEGALRHLRGQACRAVALAHGPPAGPVHVNFPFEKPLEPVAMGSPHPRRPKRISPEAWRGRGDGEPFSRVPESRLVLAAEVIDELRAALDNASRGLIVAGPNPRPWEVGPAAVALSAATGFPILADPQSGARFSAPHGAQVVAFYDLFLRSPRVRRALEPDLVVRIGAAPTSAALLEYLREHGQVSQVVVDQGHRWKDHLATGSMYLRSRPDLVLRTLTETAARRGDPSWRDRWEAFEGRTRSLAKEVPPDTTLEGYVASSLVQDLPPGASLVVANSMPIRELDAFGLPRPEPLQVLANRGASGIDGQVSTTAGVAAVSPGPVVGLLGDLAFLHDLNGLLTVKKAGIPAGFVVVNNDGGGIFEMLPVREFEPTFTEFFATPHGLDLEKAADLYGLPFARAHDGDGFRSALSELLEGGGPFILEVRVDRVGGHQARRGLMQRIVDTFEEEPPE